MIKTLITILSIGLLVVAGYYLITLEDPLVESNDSLTQQQASAQAQEYLQRFNELQTIQLNTDIFTDSRFTNLVDNSQIVQPLDVGRENPFAPVN